MGAIREMTINDYEQMLPPVVIEDNVVGNDFWAAVGWDKRSCFYIYSKNT